MSSRERDTSGRRAVRHQARREATPIGWAERFKPASSVRAQVLLAAVLWSLVGIVLGTAGVVWTVASAHGIVLALLHVSAVAVGWAKGRFLLARTARHTLARIHERGDGRCLGGFLSWRSWLLVAAMMVGGRVLRASPLPGYVLGPLYLAIGVALFTGSLTFWSATTRVRI